MFKFKKIIIIMFIVMFITLVIFTKSYAVPVTVTEENLKTSIESFITSEVAEENYIVSVENNKITLTSLEETLSFSYDLTGSPTFVAEANINQGMSYDEFQTQTDNLLSVMFGYSAVANIQGIDFEDSMMYWLLMIMNSAFSGMSDSSSSSGYVIMDDTNMSEGVTIDKESLDSNTILASEFPNRVMEYVNATYKDSQTISDSTEGINSFELTINKTNVTDTSCKLVSTLNINLNADFSQLDGMAENAFDVEEKDNTIIGNGNDTTGGIKVDDDDEGIVDEKPSNKQQNTFQDKEGLPQAGINDISLILIPIMAVIAIIFKIKSKKYKNI